MSQLKTDKEDLNRHLSQHNTHVANETLYKKTCMTWKIAIKHFKLKKRKQNLKYEKKSSELQDNFTKMYINVNEVSEREIFWRDAENIKEIMYHYTQYPIYGNYLCSLTGKQLKKMWHIFLQSPSTLSQKTEFLYFFNG